MQRNTCLHAWSRACRPLTSWPRNLVMQARVPAAPKATTGCLTNVRCLCSHAVLAYATAGLSGGQMNPAVTFGLWLAGALSWMQAIGNSIAQVNELLCAHE
mmetsp:Transcript_25641/g.75828  ORF Transcript_25641/g.75828 Transcript_25641/m.75828 type:complete len:101 (+) Transcript_25641:633-935(+)